MLTFDYFSSRLRLPRALAAAPGCYFYSPNGRRACSYTSPMMASRRHAAPTRYARHCFLVSYRLLPRLT